MAKSNERIISVLLVGTGGYGTTYIGELLEKRGYPAKVVGAVDPYAKAGAKYDALMSNGIKIYDTLSEFYAENEAELAIISTPIYLHTEQAVECMANGSDVLLEKPIAGCVADAEKIIAARDKYGKKLSIGFQWCANDAMIKLRDDVESGLFGKPKLLKAMVLWPRDFAYYARGTGWAGKKYIKGNLPLFDSIASNATAHYLFNMLWLTGKGAPKIKSIKSLTAKANDIETFDTIAMTAELDGGTQLKYYASHAISRDERQDPIFCYEFENAKIYFGERKKDSKHLYAEMNDGRIIEYGNSDNNEMTQKLRKELEYILGMRKCFCTAEEAKAHIEVIEAIHAAGDAPCFREESIVRLDDMVYAKGLAPLLTDCYDNARMPSEGELLL